jgi:DNA-binding transcriptional MerR regulator
MINPVAQPRSAGRSSSAQTAPGLTVDELARATGTTTRQVRALQTRGLLPRPHLVGRTGFYDGDHRDRLRAILRLQADGFSLAGIGTLVRAWEANLTVAEVLGLPGLSGQDAAEAEDFGDLVDAVKWPPTRSGRTLSLVPTTLLDQPAAS